MIGILPISLSRGWEYLSGWDLKRHRYLDQTACRLSFQCPLRGSKSKRRKNFSAHQKILNIYHNIFCILSEDRE
jgi:hypothetical protein